MQGPTDVSARTWFLAGPVRGRTHRSAPTKDGKVPATTRASGAQRGVCVSGCEEVGGNCGRDHPQRGYQPRTIPQSRRSRDSSLCTREPRDGGCGLPRRPVGPPRNDNGFLSFRGAERRGNPSFLRWTGVRAAVPRAWPPPTKFRSEIWGVGQVVGPYGSPRLPGQRLAKRKARKEQLVKFDFCPMTSECSTAHNARRFQQSSARALVGATSTEQDRLGPRPAARQGASRP